MSAVTRSGSQALEGAMTQVIPTSACKGKTHVTYPNANLLVTHIFCLLCQAYLQHGGRQFAFLFPHFGERNSNYLLGNQAVFPLLYGDRSGCSLFGSLADFHFFFFLIIQLSYSFNSAVCLLYLYCSPPQDNFFGMGLQQVLIGKMSCFGSGECA